MQRGVPDARAAHRKAAQRHALRIHLVGLLCEFHGFEDVRFAGPVVGVLAAAEQIDLDRAGKVVDLRALPRVERLDFVEAGEPSVLRDVQRKRPRRRRTRREPSRGPAAPNRPAPSGSREPRGPSGWSRAICRPSTATRARGPCRARRACRSPSAGGRTPPDMPSSSAPPGSRSRHRRAGRRPRAAIEARGWLRRADRSSPGSAASPRRSAGRAESPDGSGSTAGSPAPSSPEGCGGRRSLGNRQAQRSAQRRPQND